MRELNIFKKEKRVLIVLFLIISGSLTLKNQTIAAFPRVEKNTDSTEEALSLLAQEVLQGRDLNTIRDHRVWALLGGGDLVGNGGSFQEGLIRYAYSKIPTFIKDCLQSHLCRIRNEDRKILKKIMHNIDDKRHQKDALIFVDGSRYPSFFKTPNDPTPRSAKTGNNPQVPIFINVHHLYEYPKAFGDFVVLLIHEAGHQIGEPSHSRLDHIGIQVRHFVDNKRESLESDIMGKPLQIQVLNGIALDIRSDLVVAWDQQVLRLQKELFKKLSCSQPHYSIASAQLSNLHWKRAWGHRDHYKFGAWIDIFCEDTNSIVWKEERDLEVTIYITPQGELLLEKLKVSLEYQGFDYGHF